MEAIKMNQNNKNVLSFLIIIISVGLIISGCNATDKNVSPSENGRLVMTITDAAANMGSISELRITVDKIEAHSKTEGWIVIESGEQTYNLLELKSQNKAELLADSEVKVDEYNEIRFNIKEAVVVDSNGEHKAKVPSNQYKININSKVEKGQSSTIEVDILADESLHVTGNGEYIMAPVAKVETKSNSNIQILSDNSVIVKGGETTSKTTVGMDINGNIGVGLKIPADVKLEVNTKIPSGISIKIGPDPTSDNVTLLDSKGKITIGITDAAANMGTVSKVMITVDEVKVHSKSGEWVTLTTNDQQIELLELKAQGKIELILDAEVDSGEYDQVRMDIKNVIVVDNQGEHDAKLPSGEIKIMDEFNIEADTNTALTFDFIANESLHVTGEGKYIMAPVINLKTRERVTVDIQSGNEIVLQGGQESDIKVGMDIKGNVGVNNIISSKAKLKLSATGEVGLDLY